MPALASGTPRQLPQIFLDVHLHDSLHNSDNAGTDQLLKVLVLEDRQNRTDFFHQAGLVLLSGQIGPH